MAKPARAPPIPEKNPGRRIAGAAGDGWLSEREGEDGVVGLAGIGDGLAGAEYDRDPRLPPPLDRAHASPTCPASTAATATATTKINVRRFVIIRAPLWFRAAYR
jgi:hypothetical protein